MKKKLIIFLLCSLTFTGPILANEYFDTEWDFEMGYRVDEVKWSIRQSDTVKVLSELTYRDLQIFQLALNGCLVTYNNIYFRGEANGGWILSGQAQDDDYLGPNRTLLFSKSISQTNDDNVVDLSFGAGYLFDVCGTGLTIAPVVGYSYHEQNIRMTNGIQIFDLDFPEIEGPIPGLNSTYDTRWDGPWFGLDFAYDLMCDIGIFAIYEHHWPRYKGKGNWNLRSDFLGDFIHDAARGHANVVEIGINYDWCDWIIGLSSKFQKWNSGFGVDTTFISDETDIIFPASTVLNPVTWRSYSIMVDIGRCF